MPRDSKDHSHSDADLEGLKEFYEMQRRQRKNAAEVDHPRDELVHRDDPDEMMMGPRTVDDINELAKRLREKQKIEPPGKEKRKRKITKLGFIGLLTILGCIGSLTCYQIALRLTGQELVISDEHRQVLGENVAMYPDDGDEVDLSWLLETETPLPTDVPPTDKPTQIPSISTSEPALTGVPTQLEMVAFQPTVTDIPPTETSAPTFTPSPTETPHPTETSVPESKPLTEFLFADVISTLHDVTDARLAVYEGSEQTGDMIEKNGELFRVAEQEGIRFLVPDGTDVRFDILWNPKRTAQNYGVINSMGNVDQTQLEWLRNRRFITLLLGGLDTRSTEIDNTGLTGRVDAPVAITIDIDTGSFTLTSIARDTTSPLALAVLGEPLFNSLSSSYWRTTPSGNQVLAAPPDELLRVGAEQVLGIPIDGIVKANFKTVYDLINILFPEGIEYTFTEDTHLYIEDKFIEETQSYSLIPLDFAAGQITRLDGYTLVNLARSRKGEVNGIAADDTTRQGWQRRVVDLILAEVPKAVRAEGLVFLPKLLQVSQFLTECEQNRIELESTTYLNREDVCYTESSGFSIELMQQIFIPNAPGILAKIIDGQLTLPHGESTQIQITHSDTSGIFDLDPDTWPLYWENSREKIYSALRAEPPLLQEPAMVVTLPPTAVKFVSSTPVPPTQTSLPSPEPTHTPTVEAIQVLATQIEPTPVPTSTPEIPRAQQPERKALLEVTDSLLLLNNPDDTIGIPLRLNYVSEDPVHYYIPNGTLVSSNGVVNTDSRGNEFVWISWEPHGAGWIRTEDVDDILPPPATTTELPSPTPETVFYSVTGNDYVNVHKFPNDDLDSVVFGVPPGTMLLYLNEEMRDPDSGLTFVRVHVPTNPPKEGWIAKNYIQLRE